MKDEGYGTQHREDMKRSMEEPFHVLNRREQHDTGLDLIKCFVWLACGLVVGVSCWLALNWLESLVRHG